MLGMDYSARDIAMAGASIAMPNGLYGFHSNPAALGYVTRLEAAAGYRSVMLDVWSGLLAFGMPVRNTGTWAIGIINLSEGTIDEVVDVNGNPVETGRVWSSNVFAGTVSWSKLVWRDLSVGASVKGAYRYSGTEGEYYSTDGFAVDAGMQYRFLSGRVITGFVLRNLGALRATYTSESKRYALPLTVGAGVSYVSRYTPALRISLDVEKSRGSYVDFEPGVEVAILRDLLFARLGYAFSNRDVSAALDVLAGESNEGYEKTEWNSVTFGLGLSVPIREVRLECDAAVELHVLHQASVVLAVLIGI
jgi:hypothetical protein